MSPGGEGKLGQLHCGPAPFSEWTGRCVLRKENTREIFCHFQRDTARVHAVGDRAPADLAPGAFPLEAQALGHRPESRPIPFSGPESRNSTARLAAPTLSRGRTLTCGLRVVSACAVGQFLSSWILPRGRFCRGLGGRTFGAGIIWGNAPTHTYTHFLQPRPAPGVLVGRIWWQRGQDPWGQVATLLSCTTAFMYLCLSA